MIDFIDAIKNAGLYTKTRIIADGKIHRFHIEGDRPQSLNGWYVLFNDSLPSGAFGCWKRNINERWSAKGYRKLDYSERNALSNKMREARIQNRIESNEKRALAAKKAQAIWDKSQESPDTYPYLVKKSVKSHGIKIDNNKLIIPMFDIEGNLHSVQTIDEEGNKRFLSGGRKKGCFFALGSPQSALNIAEGYSTAATLYEVTGIPTALAFDAGNIIHVAKAFRTKFPALEITICADNDSHSPQNIGVTKAKEAALAVNGTLAVPPCHGDFNDFYNGVK